MRIGIIELMSAGINKKRDEKIYHYLVTKQYASIMPQAISYWCRNLGHEVFYATFIGNNDPKTLVPGDLDVVFIAAYTQASSLAYALAKLFRREKTLTVIGGPHAKQFPDDCQRFFDIVVGDCDKALIREILTDKPRGQFLTSGRPLAEIPGIEERMPEIRHSTFFRGKPFPFTSIPMLTSTGCPNSCDFCIDWDNSYRLLSLDQLRRDMTYLFQKFPRVLVGFHDPNFAVKFEQVFDVLESIPNHKRNLYIVETSLSVLKRSRLERLKQFGDFYLVPGIESWTDYSNKIGAATRTEPRKKMGKVVEQLKDIRQHVAGIQANFMFGLDADFGNEPTEITKEFANEVPFVMPNFNIPVPFGNTPLFQNYVSENRILKSMPFSFYYMPYLVYSLKNYDPISFYKQLIGVYKAVYSNELLMKRLKSKPNLIHPWYDLLKTLGNRQMVARFQQILTNLESDKQFRAFHEHYSDELPEYYHHIYESTLGPYAELLSRDDRKPVLICDDKIGAAYIKEPVSVTNSWIPERTSLDTDYVSQTCRGL